MTKIIKLLPTDLIAIEVPKDASHYKIIKTDNQTVLRYFTGFVEWKAISLGKDDFEILGEVISDEITFDTEPYVEKNHFISMFDGKETYNYKNHLFPHYMCLDVKESFYSLLQSNGLYFVNPVEKPLWRFKNSEERWGTSEENTEWKKFKEAESKVIKGKILILKPI